MTIKEIKLVLNGQKILEKHVGPAAQNSIKMKIDNCLHLLHFFYASTNNFNKSIYIFMNLFSSQFFEPGTNAVL